MEEMGMELTPEQAVKNGAEWLDKVYPEWWMKVDVGRLEMDSTVSCICGQIFGCQSYEQRYSQEHCWVGYDAINQVAYMAGLNTDNWSDTHGFSGWDSIYNPLWVTEIKHRADIGLVD